MAIIKGAINFGSNFNIGAKGPIDARQRVETIADLTTVWTADIPAYKGMVVSVLQDNSIYILTADDATKKENWKKIGDVSGDITNLQDQITANKAAIDVINGAGDGSITKAVSDAKTELIGNDATADTIKHAEKLATDASEKVDTEIGKLNSTVHNEAASAGDAASTQIKVTVEETKGKLTGVTVNAPSFESAGAASAVKTELLGATGVSGNTIISAKEDAAAAKTAADNASKKVDTAIAGLDGGGTSPAVKGVTVTVNETDGIIATPVVAIADGTLTGAATDGNLVTGTVVKKYVDDKVSDINASAATLGNRVTTLEDKVGDETKGLVKGLADVKTAIDTINGDGDGSITKAVSDAKTELIGNDATADTIRHAEKLATDASKKVDTAIAALDVTGNTSEAVKGVTITVNETDGKVITPVVSIADGTIGKASDGNLVTGSTVKTYVDGEIAKVNTAAGELGTRVTTLEGKVGKLDATHTTKGDGSFNTVAEEVTTGIAGITETSKANKAGSDVVVTVTTKSGSVSSVAVDSSVLKKAVTDGDASVKSDLIDNATGEYNTLGKLETKIKAEASTARAEEKKNADAIAAETTRATAAEEKVKTDLLGGATDDYNTLGKLETKIKAAQSAADKVSGVKSGDKVISLGADGELSSTISLSIDATAGDDGKKYIHLNGIGGADLGKIDIADFVRDGMLDSASLVTNPAGQPAGTYIKLTWNTDGGKDPMYINVTSLIDVYTAGNGLNLSGHEFSVNFDVAATKDSVDKVAGRVTTLEGKVGSAAVEGGAAATGLYKDIADNKAAIAAEITRAKAAEKANADAITAETTRATAAEEANAAAIATETTRATAAEAALLGADGDDATKDTIKGAKKAVEDLKTQIEAEAVTLTIPEDDPYITASKEGNTNKYTISSKKDGTTPLVDIKIDAKLTDKINSLDGGGTSPAVKGVTVTVNETDGIVAPPSISIADGTLTGAATDENLVTGKAVKTYVDTAITNAALVWHDIPTTA